MVRIHPDPPRKTARKPNATPGSKSGEAKRGCSSVGRAPALQAGGRRFDPVQLHQFVRRPASEKQVQSPEVNAKVYF